MTVIYRLVQSKLKGNYVRKWEQLPTPPRAHTLGTKETSDSISLLPSARPAYFVCNIDCKLEITNMIICVKRKAGNKFNTDRICTYHVSCNNKSNRYVGLEIYGTRKRDL
jgi:hypothetical protein